MGVAGSNPVIPTFIRKGFPFLLRSAMYFTYILFSEKLNKYYVGQTSNPEQRLIDHNAIRVRFFNI